MQYLALFRRTLIHFCLFQNYVQKMQYNDLTEFFNKNLSGKLSVVIIYSRQNFVLLSLYDVRITINLLFCRAYR